MLAPLLLALAGAPRARAGVYVHQYSYVQDNFFSSWNFLAGVDPTHGTVEYVGQAEAEAAGLIRATADHVYMGVDMETVLPAGTGRRSVRVQSRTAYSEGLFVLQVEHVPTGCGLWPAFWMFGADPAHPWPTWGEYDIIEGVHRATRVMTTLHTSQHCTQEEVGYGAGPAVEWGTGRHGRPATDCYVAAPDQWQNQGCTQTGPESTMGAAFNAAGGGTYAAEWDPQAGHIRTWFWPRGSEPPDLVLQQPNPNSWGPAYSYFSIDPRNCDPAHFQQMRLVFDITFCGDMGDPTFADSCPDQAVQGLNCEDFVRLHPEEMTEAYWGASGLPNLPWNRLIPANLHNNSWSRVALDDKDQKGEDDLAGNRFPSQGSPHGTPGIGGASTGGLGAAPPVLSVRGGGGGTHRGRSVSPKREARGLSSAGRV